MSGEEANSMLQSVMKHHHMQMPWHNFTPDNSNTPAKRATLKEKATLVGRVGIMLLSYGTGAWRVRDSMNTIARELNVSCSADVGLVSIEYTCVDEEGHGYTQALSLASTGVNTDKLSEMEQFVMDFNKGGSDLSSEQIHEILDEIERKPGHYTAIMAGLAAASACCAFVFLLGGGLVEMLCSFVGAGFGNYIRRKMIERRITLLACVSVSVAVACIFYLKAFKSLVAIMHVSLQHEAGYIGAMLFVIPGFPFITSGLDIAKLDMRSGLERMMYAIMIITVATLVGWVVAMAVHLKPVNFIPLDLGVIPMMLLRIPASFVGVFGFSIMFNSTIEMATWAGIIGAIANTLRLELVDLTNIPAGAAAFTAALVAGLLASLIKGYPRISLTVPSIVIMVPGLYMYRAVYNIGVASINVGATWLTEAALIVMFLPLGLITARILTDKKWRYKD